jgi:hypothetical protein
MYHLQVNLALTLPTSILLVWSSSKKSKTKMRQSTCATDRLSLLQHPSPEMLVGESADTTLAEERDNAQLLSDLSLCEELVSLYFRYIHDKFHSIFHRPRLMESVANRTVPKIILYAIASLSARYTYATPLLSFYLLPSLVRTSLWLPLVAMIDFQTTRASRGSIHASEAQSMHGKRRACWICATNL